MSGAALTLEPSLGLEQAAPLARALGECGRGDLTVDAGAVTHLGALCLQVLMAAARDRAAAGERFRLANPTDRCVEQLSLFGLTPETLAGDAP